jgi:nucleoside-diphosphate-sugar epimerase
VLLIIGCGDVGLRVARQLLPRWRVLALTSSAARMSALRAAGIEPLWGDLDRPETLGRLGTLADRVLHLAPPPLQGRTCPRTAALVRALARGGRTSRLVYASTTGVYGDCGGAWIDETRAVAPQSDRAWRRVHAEALVRHFGRRTGAAVSVLRIPGIYAPDREGGQPQDRVRRGAPVLAADDDVYTNHIHADDLARACVKALLRGAPQRVVNVCDDSDRAMGDHYDRVADLAGLPRPPRLARETLKAQVTPMQWSFLCESRRIGNRRLREELGVVLRYPTIEDGLFAADALTR